MTRDARLSALHRGDFWPGAALPSPALPPDPYSDAPRSQVVVPGGRCPGPPEPAVTSRSRRTPLPAPPSGPSLEDAPHERGWRIHTIASLGSQWINANRSQRAHRICFQREAPGGFSATLGVRWTARSEPASPSFPANQAAQRRHSPISSSISIGAPPLFRPAALDT